MIILESDPPEGGVAGGFFLYRTGHDGRFPVYVSNDFKGFKNTCY